MAKTITFTINESKTYQVTAELPNDMEVEPAIRDLNEAHAKGLLAGTHNLVHSNSAVSVSVEEHV